jgi:hypothetical protein
VEREAAGLHLVPVVAECEHTPQAGTIYTHTCLPVESGRAGEDDYPLDAMCAVCGQPIRRQREFLCDWQLKQ